MRAGKGVKLRRREEGASWMYSFGADTALHWPTIKVTLPVHTEQERYD